MKQVFATPSAEGRTIRVVSPPPRTAQAGKAGRKMGPERGSVVGDVRAVMAENARLRAEVQRLRGELAVERFRGGR